MLPVPAVVSRIKATPETDQPAPDPLKKDSGDPGSRKGNDKGKNKAKTKKDRYIKYEFEKTKAKHGKHKHKTKTVKGGFFIHLG